MSSASRQSGHSSLFSGRKYRHANLDVSHQDDRINEPVETESTQSRHLLMTVRSHMTRQQRWMCAAGPYQQGAIAGRGMGFSLVALPGPVRCHCAGGRRPDQTALIRLTAAATDPAYFCHQPGPCRCENPMMLQVCRQARMKGYCASLQVASGPPSGRDLEHWDSVLIWSGALYSSVYGVRPLCLVCSRCTSFSTCSSGGPSPPPL